MLNIYALRQCFLLKPFHDLAVKIIAAQLRIPPGRENLDDIAVKLYDAHIEGSAAQIVDQYVLLLLAALGDTVGQSRSRGLIDHAQHWNLRHIRGVLGRLPLGVRKVSRNRNNRAQYLLAQGRLHILFDLLQDNAGDFFRPVTIPVYLIAHMTVAHVSFCKSHKMLRIQHALFLGIPAHNCVAILKIYCRRGDPVALLVADDLGIAVRVDIRRNRKCGSQINSYIFTHNVLLSIVFSVLPE